MRCAASPPLAVAEGDPVETREHLCAALVFPEHSR
jgi:hypothetical protein